LLRRQLLQAQKMEAIGTLAGGIAHDFNNLLQVTLGYADILLEEKPIDDPDRPDLYKIMEAARKGSDLVQRLLTFSRKIEPKAEALDLNFRVLQIEPFLRRTIPKMIEIDLRLQEPLPTINADPTQIDQILMNLAVNARDAMPDGGKLIIETNRVAFDEEFIKENMDAKPGNYVRLQVSDQGVGMDQETLQHVFEPFYTTKELGRGTGLGLAMVYGIVEQHGGMITCASEAQVGTTFAIYLPVMEDGRR
jgi:two-component system cell cycle sensor histidine kinase/response regulator CckA